MENDKRTINEFIAGLNEGMLPSYHSLKHKTIDDINNGTEYMRRYKKGANGIKMGIYRKFDPEKNETMIRVIFEDLPKIDINKIKPYAVGLIKSANRMFNFGNPKRQVYIKNLKNREFLITDIYFQQNRGVCSMNKGWVTSCFMRCIENKIQENPVYNN